jgi:hypothetical protein
MQIARELTKEQLYREARRLRIKGRSKMSKGQLKLAVSRHCQWVADRARVPASFPESSERARIG